MPYGPHLRAKSRRFAAVALVMRACGRRPTAAHPPITTIFRFIGTIPVPQRSTGGHMGSPLRGIWDVTPFNRHRKSSKRGPPWAATPTALIGRNPNCRGGPNPPVPRPRRAGKSKTAAKPQTFLSPLLVGGGQGGSERRIPDRSPQNVPASALLQSPSLREGWPREAPARVGASTAQKPPPGSRRGA